MKDIVERLCSEGSDLNKVEPCLYGSLMIDAAAEIERLRAALTEIAAFNDAHANNVLEKTGSWGAFDEPASVEIARAALKGGEG